MFTLPGKDGVTDFPLPDEDGMFQHPNGRTYRQSSGILDLIEGDWDQTADHYTEQWGPDSDFQAFARQNPEAMRFTPGRQLGWPMLFESIRTRALDIPTLVYDAGCGFGGVLDALFAEPSPCSLYYLGADIHGSLATVRRPERVGLDRVRLVRWDISRPLPFRQKFDFVICRASIHHTVEPRTTFKSLVASLAAHGTIAISAYTTKSRPREAIDNSLRAEISRMPVEAAKR